MKKEDQIEKFQKILDSDKADPKLKESLKNKIKVLEGNKTVLK